MSRNILARAWWARACLPSGLAGALLLAIPGQAAAQVVPDAVAAAMREADAPKEVRAFYAARDHRPIWVRDGAVGTEAETLLRLIGSAELDRLDPDGYRPRKLAELLDRAENEASPKALARIEYALSRALATLARDMRRPRDMGVVYADPQLAPAMPTFRAVLEEAAAAPSLATYLNALGWMNPHYARLRNAAAGSSEWAVDPGALATVRVNLDRARLLPASSAGGRYVLVDAAAARLWMMDGDKVAGTMRVVVGKPSEPTPMMAGLIRYASVNPYWNIPPDLVRLRVAPGARTGGAAFLKAKRFEVLSGWEPDAAVVAPETVDWAAVETGRIDARVRQLPGPANAMGRIKFMFPNDRGIYLHDTPEKALLKEDERLFSSGCVRVEDAPRLARWLFGRAVPLKGGKPERRVDLPSAVPVYITYLTVAGEGDTLVFRADPYGRDGARTLASR